MKGAQEVNIIYVREELHDKSIEAVEWFLITNEKIDSAESAYEIVTWYM